MTAASLRDRGFRGRLDERASLAPFTTWRIGGPAELLAQPTDRDDLCLAVAWAAEHAVPWRVLGNGSNLLVRDEGVGGLVLRLRRVLDSIERDGATIDAGAGASFPALARRAAAWGLEGLEFAGGVPGTVGGAIVMNAGWHEHETAAVVRRVEALDPAGRVVCHDAEACRFVYRGSRFRGGDEIVLAARFELAAGEPDAIAERLESFASSRKRNQPTEWPSCGSVFLKPPGDFAGRLIDEAGLKGERVGAVEVSPKHANFFVNHGGASAADVLRLVERVERIVLERFGVRLEREFELW